MTLIYILVYIIASIVCVSIYMIPSVIAYKRKHPQFIPILIIDLFFGWSGIAWVGVLAWSFSNVSKEKPTL